VGPIEKIRFALTGHPVAQRIDFIDAISHPRQGVFDVLIAEDDLLTRDISLPKMAKSALDSAVRLNVSAETPFDLETIAYAYKVLRKDKEKTDLRQFLVRRSRIQEWHNQLESVGIQVRKFIVKGTPDAVLADYTTELKQPYVKWQYANAGLTAVLLCLIGLAGWQKVSSLEATKALAETELAELRVDVSKLRTELEAQTDRTGSIALIQARQSEAEQMLEHIDVLAQKLPDDTWVSFLEMDSEFVRLDGNTKNAPTDLISMLSNSGAFGTPILISGFAVGDGSGQQSFEIEIPVMSKVE